MLALTFSICLGPLSALLFSTSITLFEVFLINTICLSFTFLTQSNSIKCLMEKFSSFTFNVKTYIWTYSFLLKLINLEKCPLLLSPLILRCFWLIFCLDAFLFDTLFLSIFVKNGWWTSLLSYITVNII